MQYLADPDVTLYHGDALAVLRELPDESVDCAATSPPFYGLRDYGVEGQIGLEETPELWRDRLVEVFREVRRVLVPTGTLWVECGDSYNSNPSWGRGATTLQGRPQNHIPNADHMRKFRLGATSNLKPKDLMLAPFLLAFGLRDDGWWLRSVNIWMKPNCLPESVTDRPVVQHSYVMQFSKRARYYHDAEAVREPAEWARWGDQTVVKEQQGKGAWIGPNSKEYLTQGRTTNGPRSTANREQTPGFEQRLVSADGTKSLRSVWQIPTEGFPEAHFATWPTKLAERILLMACPEQVCRECGKARERIQDRFRHDGFGNPVTTRYGNGGLEKGHRDDGIGPRGAAKRHRTEVTTVGFTDCGCRTRAWEHSTACTITPCICKDGPKYRPGVVLDPFLGSGTTALIARKLGRCCVGIELNESYCEMAARRLAQQSLFATEVAE